MTSELIFFLFLAVVAIVSAGAMLLAHNPVYSAIFLALNFSAIAVFYLMLQAPFIAMAQITVYAGAIMVLFLFVVMLLGGEALPDRKNALPWQQPLAVALAAGLLFELIYLFFLRGEAGAGGLAVINTVGVPEEFGSPENIGLVLFREYLLPFEVTSILLLVAMISAIALTQVRRQRKAAQSQSEPR